MTELELKKKNKKYDNVKGLQGGGEVVQKEENIKNYSCEKMKMKTLQRESTEIRKVKVTVIRKNSIEGQCQWRQ